MFDYTTIEGQAASLDLAFAYTGRLLDHYTDLQNNLNRWYDASVGRWLSEGPIGFRAGDANLYRYVGNGPVNGTDPSGLDPAFAPTIGIGSPFYRRDPVLPIDGAMQEPQYIWVCLGAYGAVGGAAIGGGALVGGTAVGSGGLSSGAQQVLLNYGSRPEAMAALAQLQAINDALPRGSNACIRLTKRLDQFEAAIREAFPFK